MTSAPTSGVRVLDRSTQSIVTWHNGTSVVLWEWATDKDTYCGVNGDSYVWEVLWYAGGTVHRGVLGDWWLATGSYSDWSVFTDYAGELKYDNAGSSSGTCDVFNPGGW